MDIETSIRGRLPVLIIVKNNRAYVDHDGGKSQKLATARFAEGVDIASVAMALGARAVMVGRSVQWGLATGGEAGIVRMLELVGGEFRSAMALCGARNPAEITRDMVTPNPDPTAGRI